MGKCTSHQIGLTLCGCLILLITCRITDRSGLHSVLLPLSLVMTIISYAVKDNFLTNNFVCPQLKAQDPRFMEPIHEYVLYTDAIKVCSQNLVSITELFNIDTLL